MSISELSLEGNTIYPGFIHDLSREKEAEDQLCLYTQQLEQQVADRTATLQNLVSALEEVSPDSKIPFRQSGHFRRGIHSRSDNSWFGFVRFPYGGYVRPNLSIKAL